MPKEYKDVLTRWGVILGILVALLTITGALKAAGDDRYVTKAAYKEDVGQIKGDVRVIRAAVCAQSPAACQPVTQ